MAANLEQIASMFRVTYSKDPANGSAADAFVVDKTASDWLWWWHRYLKENRDYEAYCAARRTGDSAACAALEAQFERVAEVYSDWGDIHDSEPVHRNEASWQRWLYEKRHLFFVEVPPIKVIDPATSLIDNGGVAIQIPATASQDELMRMFGEFVEQIYATSRKAIAPKYQLHAPQGRIDQSTLQSVKKAFYVNVAAQHHDAHPETHAGTALEIMALELKNQLGFSWELDPDQEQRLLNGTLSMLELESVKKQVARYKAQYDAYVSNTIHGEFPKK
ncbi:hypothetical protein AB4Z27_28570 [Cupriavidus sp. KB_39]|uniref:hypothetical protein n=1 Tax=Cupriavidus sp. KB_39 TaxID=3233036 RepID=UPI003F8E9681